MNINKIKKLLSLDNNIELIGSNANNELKYDTDYDMQEHLKINNVEDNIKILNKFKNIFKKAKASKDIFITDMKSGTFNTLPVRWSHDDIIKGVKLIDTKQINFIDTLYNKNNTVKIDLIAYINKEYVEFSCNYYFNVNKPSDNVRLSLLLDIKKYYHENKYMKMLKRIMSYRNIKKQSNKELIAFFNSDVGLLYQSYHKLDVILLLLDKFDDVNMTNVIYAVNKIIDKIPNKYIDEKIDVKNLISSLANIKAKLNEYINNLVINFI